jgi:vacuolar iron transporter family protein
MATQPAQTFFQRIEQSFMSSAGAIVFGMEDGTVSIFGLVLGVAASATNSQTVLLAGATGAISAAVSMMAGTYLDVSTERDQAQAAVATKQREIQQNPQAETQKVQDQFKQAGFSDADTQTIMSIIQGTPGALLKTATAFELPIGPSAQPEPLGAGDLDVRGRPIRGVRAGAAVRVSAT